MKIDFDLYGNCCNEYPFVTIKYNNHIVYEGYIQQRQVVSFDVELQDTNKISLQGLKKSNGVNGKWDTQMDDQGGILADKNLLINDIKIENISMGVEWIKDLLIKKENNEIEACLMGMFTNGIIEFEITAPALSWIIEQKFINREKKLSLELNDRSGQSKFEYDIVIEKIKSIKKIINDQNSNH